MKKFEYKVIYSQGNQDWEELLNDLGEQGWELVSMSQTQSTRTGLATFKRELREAWDSRI